MHLTNTLKHSARCTARTTLSTLTLKLRVGMTIRLYGRKGIAAVTRSGPYTIHTQPMPCLTLNKGMPRCSKPSMLWTSSSRITVQVPWPSNCSVVRVRNAARVIPGITNCVQGVAIC